MTALFAHARRALVTLAAAAVIAVSAPAMAQELAPEHLAAARKYIDLTDKSAVFEVTLVETGIDAMRQIVTQNPEIVDETNAAIESVLQNYSGRKGELLDQFARIYALRFTREELEEISAFYESEVGQKLATANSEVNQDLQRVMQVFNSNLQREFYSQVRAELRSQGIEL
jgi:hypothetical protein